MYGSGAQAARNVDTVPQAPVEQISSINENTLKNLCDAKDALDVLLAKVRGHQPSEAETNSNIAERHLLASSYELRDVSYQVLTRVNELHRIIGHEK